jgi:hypothetical protein
MPMRLHSAVLAFGICAAGCAGVQEDMPVTPSKSASPRVDVEKKRIELPGLVIAVETKLTLRLRPQNSAQKKKKGRGR